MKFKISDYFKYRILEIIPGSLIWITLILAVSLSFLKPLWMVYFVIIFDFYWMTKVVYMSVYLISAFKRYKHDIKINWLAKCEEKERFDNIYHLIFLPNYNESWEVVKTTFDSLIKINYPLDKMIIVFAAEERTKEISLTNAERAKKEYGDKFFKFFINLHPNDIPGELAGKGANVTHAGRKVKAEIIDPLEIPYQNIIVSTFDVDTCVHPEYFSYLTYKYLTHPNPTRSSYQPIPLFNNNIWDAPALMRVASNGTSFWLMSEQMRPERLLTFSSHSMSFKALVDVDFWQTDIVSDDSRIFIQCFLEYDGKYETTPLYIPISMDTVLADNIWESLKNLYKQQRRWAWGSENIPFMIWNFMKAKQIPLKKRLKHIFNQIEGMWSWATAPVLIFILGYLPLYISMQGVAKESVIAQNAPFALQYILTVANIGLILSMILGTLLLPPRPDKYKKRRYLSMVIQWILLPVSMILFGSIPAIDAQTRLMLGKYMGFYVTKKSRK